MPSSRTALLFSSQTKKRWTKSCAQMSYFQNFQATLLKATSRALDSICKQTWPPYLGQLSIPQIWRKIHSHFKTTDDSISLTCVNDDLVGFFNSVPQTRLLDAIHQLLDQWMLAHEKHFWQ